MPKLGLASLNSTDTYGYYGLRVLPSFDKAVEDSRKPLRIPIPDRYATWYALSPYRALIVDAENRFNDFQHAQIDYRQSGAELPEQAAMVRESDSAHDPVFDRMRRQHEDLEEHYAHVAAQAAQNEMEARQAQQHRHDLLKRMYRPRHAHPMVEAAHRELAEAGVPHHYIADEASPTARERHQRRSAELPLAYGYTVLPQLPTFQDLNAVDSHGHLPPLQRALPERTYEAMRREAFIH